ncbi:hypothetical protein N0B16_03570 [Chryseobacterium sp. GMJ5]|uniref:Uncharacterized protein n=1 Tax=Chryseobacterium gilvum TaxID=2976534 RepID=A0ABT2VUG5_9FLAO|nr:hypothetical protein [Chryseobacterium gilvum]MCU7613506.1 hypothetical protein [Chryseobacterium gilvum]
MFNLFLYKSTILRYLQCIVADDFNIKIDLKNDLRFVKNIVSKKIIIVPFFSDQCTSNIILKNYLGSVITNINYGNITLEDIKKTLSHH